MFGRDKSERFRTQLPSPGPGDYDPAHPGDVGFRADVRSSFTNSGRFSTGGMSEDESGRHSGLSMSPRRRIPSRPNSRTNDWTTNRIKDLETELRISKAKVMELQQVIRESEIEDDRKKEFEDELREIKNKLLEQKGSTAQAQRETIRVEGDKKKLENELANMSMRVKKAEENRKIAEAKVAEAKFRVSDLEQQMVTIEDEHAANEDNHRSEIQTLKRRLSVSESFKNTQNQDETARLQALSTVQQQQLASMEEELSASRAAAENLISENLAEILVMKAELTVASDREAEKDDQITQIRGELKDVRDRIYKALKEKAEVESELTKMRSENDEKAQKLTKLSKELQAAETELKNRDQRVQQLQTKLTSTQSGKFATGNLKETEQSVGVLKSDLEAKTRDVQALTDKVVEITKLLGEEFTPEEQRDLNKKLEKFGGLVQGRHEKLLELEKLTEGQASELKHLGNKVATVLKEKKAKVGELERQKKEEKSLRRSLAEQENNMNNLSQRLETAEAQMAEEAETKVNLQNELKMVRLQLGEKTVEAAELQQKTEQLSKAAGETTVKAPAQTVTKLQSELEQARSELAARQAAVQELQNKVNQLGNNVGEKGTSLTNLQEQLQNLTKERDALTSALESCRKELTQSKSEGKKNSDAVTDLKKEVSKLESRLTKAVENKKKAEEAAEQTLKQKTELEDRLAKSKAAYKNAQSTVSSQTQELAKLGAEKRQLETQLDSTHGNKDKSSSQLEKKLAAAQKALKDREEEIRVLQAEMDDTAKVSENVKGAQNKAQIKLAKAENEARQKTALVQELQTQVKALKQENTELLRTQEQAADAARSKLAEREKKLQRVERELSQLKEKIGDGSTEERQSDHATENELRAMLKEQKRKYESQIRALKLEPTSIKELRSEVSAAQAVSNSTRKQNESLRQQLKDVKERLAFFEGTNPAHDEELDEIDILKESLREAERKVNESQKLAAEYRHQLRQSNTIKLEMERLEEENMHLHTRTTQLSADMSGLMQSSGSFLGHRNSKQKIQYHLKLKTELEEMRQQYTILSREKFKLEQAIRYMAARADLMSGNPVVNISGTGIRSPSAALAPASTKHSVVLSTPTAKKHMKWASRGRGTTKAMSAYKPRESMERGIEETQIATKIESEAFKQDVSQVATAGPSDPVITPLSSADHVESRILSTISSVVTGRRRRQGLTD